MESDGLAAGCDVATFPRLQFAQDWSEGGQVAAEIGLFRWTGRRTRDALGASTSALDGLSIGLRLNSLSDVLGARAFPKEGIERADELGGKPSGVCVGALGRLLLDRPRISLRKLLAPGPFGVARNGWSQLLIDLPSQPRA